jgi:hypothetical protein
VEHDVLEPDAALLLSFDIRRVIPGEVIHWSRLSTTCAHKAHIGIGCTVPTSVANAPMPDPTQQESIPLRTRLERLDQITFAVLERSAADYLTADNPSVSSM